MAELDNGKAIVDAVEAKVIDIKSKFDKEREEYRKDAELKQAALQKEVDELKTDGLAKGATILQIQELQKDFNKKAGRQKGTNFVQTGRQSMRQLELMTAKALGEQEKTLIEYNEGKGSLFNMQLKVGDITDSSFTTTNAYPYNQILDWRSGMEPTGQIRFRDLVNTLGSSVDNVLYPRANIPVGTGSVSKQTTEGSVKGQVDRGYTMIALTLYPYAGWANVSRQALRNIIFLQGWLPTSMNEQLMDYEDIDFCNTLSGAAAGSTSVTAAGGDTNVIAKLVAFITNLRKAKYAPNNIAIDPTMWAQVVLTKAVTSGQYSLPNVVTVDANGNVRIMGVPVQPVNWLFGNRVIVGDWTKASIVESEGLTFRSTDSHASLFVANELTFLIERVEGLAIFRPDAFISAGL